MKKYSFGFAILFSVGCTQIQNITTPEPPQTIRNTKCFESQKLKILQVIDKGIMAFLCPVEFPSFYQNAFAACVAEGDLIYMPVKPELNDYVDDQKIELPENKCFISDGTYKYITAKDETEKTIRKIKIIDSQVPNPAYGIKK